MLSTSAKLSNAEVDATHMRRCVELASQAAGQTRPNPAVGCVLTSPSGAVLAEGHHVRAGLRHAEAAALHDATMRGVDVSGATAYVSLEPCHHTGRTPPCSVALIDAHVKRVVIGVVDPDPRTAGQGVSRLRAAGIHVDVGIEERLCRDLNEGFFHRILHGTPFGILKYAMTLDGKIATQTGSSKWVTGPASRASVHKLRSQVDAIIIGGQTLRADDARLTVRVEGSPIPYLAPVRVVMTRSMDLPRDARIWADASSLRTVVLTVPGHGRELLVADLRARGVEVVEVPGLRARDAMSFLHDHADALSVMWECGGALAAEAINDGCVQKIHAFIAPKLVGGSRASTPSPVGAPALVTEMSEALVLDRQTVQQIGSDVLITGYL
jgi:diaminohydroxyphosphoribosylaminopyrimidine deaminase / 5-amino-6-(5-phosphoribosylamino)uracil reductase